MRKTILVVEENAGRRNAMVQVLTGAGYYVIAGEGLDAALQTIDRIGVDVMITDFHVSTTTPHGQALARLAARKPSPLKLLFVSPVPVATRAKRPRHDILPMPLDRTVLLDKVRSLLAT